jgi:hypothetical protein
MNGTPHDRAHLSPAAWEAVEDTLSAYALDALPPEGAQAVDEHLAICAACRERLAELRAAAGLLALAVEPDAPSPGLKARLFAAVELEQRTDKAGVDGAPPPTPLPDRRPSAPPPGPATAWAPRGARRGGFSLAWLLPTAALLLIGLGLGVWNLQLQQRVQRQERQIERQADELRRLTTIVQVFESARQTVALSGTAAAPAASGTLVVAGESVPPTLLLRDLPALPASQAYQVWYIRDGQPVSAQVLSPGVAGEQEVQLSSPPAGAQQVAVSVEPAGGSPSPTGAVVLAGRL